MPISRGLLLKTLFINTAICLLFSASIPTVKANTFAPTCIPHPDRAGWVDSITFPDQTIKTAENFEIKVKFNPNIKDIMGKDFQVYLGDSGNNHSNTMRIPTNPAQDSTITFTLTSPDDAVKDANVSLKTPGSFTVVGIGYVDVCNPLGKLTIEPGRKSNCDKLAPIPISVDPTSGTLGDQYKVTLHWEDLSADDFQKYKDTDVNIYVNKSTDPNDPNIVISGDTTDNNKYGGRVQKNADFIFSDIMIPDGDQQVYVHLGLNFGNVCRGYEKSPQVIQIKSLTSTLPPGTTPPPPGTPGKKRGDYCDLNNQVPSAPDYTKCPVDFPCEPVGGTSNGPAACGGRGALCEVQKNCSWGGLPTPAKFATYTCDSSGNVGTGTTQCLKAGGVQCDPETGREGGVGGVSTAIGCIPTDPPLLIKKLLQFATGAGGGIALLLMIFGAFQWITSTGNPDSMKKAQDQFTNAAIGLLFIIFSIMILKIIGVDILQIPGFPK